MKEKDTFVVKNDLGEEVVCHVLFTFESEETNKNYIVYTDNTKDETGNITDDTRIKAALPTINYLVKQNNNHIVDLIETTFNKFVAPYYTNEGLLCFKEKYFKF